MFSVVIPLYNKAHTVVKTISSVFEQDFKSFEVIVVDDGSTDMSLQLAKSIADKRLRLFSNKHQGVSEARNYGIKKANFEFIAFLDADDYWDSNYLSQMEQLISKYNDCALYGSAYRAIKKENVEIIGNSIKEGIIDDYFKERLQQRIMRTSATVARRDIFNIVGGFPAGMIGGEDEYTWTKIALHYKIAFTPKVLATYNNIYSGFLCRIGQDDTCDESWFDFYKKGELYRNEFIAQKAIIAGIRYALGTSKVKSLEIERKTRYVKLSNPYWYYLFLLNRYPFFIAQALFKLRKKYYKLISYLKFRDAKKNITEQSFEMITKANSTIVL